MCVEIENSGDVGVIEFRECESFAAKTLARSFVGQKAGWKNLESDIAFEVLIKGAIDFAHTACPDFLKHEIMAQSLADHCGSASNGILLPSDCRIDISWAEMGRVGRVDTIAKTTPVPQQPSRKRASFE